MRISQAVSGRLATKLALYYFFRPIPFPIPRREKPARQKASRFQLHTHKSPFELFEWGSGDRTVVMMHGWSGRGSQFFKITEQLVKQGFRVLALDAPAHGESQLKRSHMLEFVDALEVVAKKYGPIEAAIGHSMGGMAIFNAMKREGFSPSKLIIIGTPANIRNVVTDFCNRLKANAKVARGIINYIENRYDMEVENVSTDQLAAELNPAGLIIHDEHDLDVALENARITAAHWPRAELVVTSGLGHRKILMDRDVIDRISDFLNQE